MTKFTPVFLFRLLVTMAVFSLAGVSVRAAGDDASSDAQAPEAQKEERSASYQLPKPEEIEAVMDRILAHAEQTCEPRVIDTKTGEEIVDFTTPVQTAATKPGGYPFGVLHAGMLLAGETTHDRRFTDFTAQWLQLLADRLPYFKAQAEKFGLKGNALRNFIEPTSLDACGAWGAALIKARRAEVGGDLKSTIDLYADYISNKQYRLKDGTLARHSPQEDSVWGDDMYMSIPFLAQMGKLTGDTRYYDDAVRQALQISARLFDWQKGLFAHGWSAGNADYNPEFHWGRANGWCMMAMAELLTVLPVDRPGREAVLKIFRTQVKAIAPLQSGDGLWHQLLDHNDSYLETSCSAMFVFSMARGINQGWISAASYGPVAQAGWNAIAAKVNPHGGVDGVCIGTNYGSDSMFYYHRPAMDDIHGYGPTLLAGSEMIRLITNPHIGIQHAHGGGDLYIYTLKP
jgi:unsaturated rhamnogalacturonyl hydrolase